MTAFIQLQVHLGSYFINQVNSVRCFWTSLILKICSIETFSIAILTEVKMQKHKYCNNRHQNITTPKYSAWRWVFSQSTQNLKIYIRQNSSVIYLAFIMKPITACLFTKFLQHFISIVISFSTENKRRSFHFQQFLWEVDPEAVENHFAGFNLR